MYNGFRIDRICTLLRLYPRVRSTLLLLLLLILLLQTKSKNNPSCLKFWPTAVLAQMKQAGTHDKLYLADGV